MFGMLKPKEFAQTWVKRNAAGVHDGISISLWFLQSEDKKKKRANKIFIGDAERHLKFVSHQKWSQLYIVTATVNMIE